MIGNSYKIIIKKMQNLYQLFWYRCLQFLMQQEIIIGLFSSRPENYTFPVDLETKKNITIFLYNIAYLMVFQNEFNQQYRKFVCDSLQGSEKQMLMQIINTLLVEYDYIKRQTQYLFEESDQEKPLKLIPVFTNILSKVQLEQTYQISLQGLDNILKFIFDDDLIQEWQLEFLQKQLYSFCKHTQTFLPKVASVFVKNLQFCHPITGYHFPPNKNLNKDTQVVMEYLLFIGNVKYDYDGCDLNSLLIYCSYYLIPTIDQLHLISTYPWLFLKQRPIVDQKKQKVLKLLLYFIQNNHQYCSELISKISKSIWNQFGDPQLSSNLNIMLGTPTKIPKKYAQTNKTIALYIKYLTLTKDLTVHHTHQNIIHSILSACKYNMLKYGQTILFKNLIEYLASTKPWEAIYLALKINEIVVTFELFENLHPARFQLHYFSRLQTQLVIQENENLHVNLKKGFIILNLLFVKNVVENFNYIIIVKVIQLPFIEGNFFLMLTLLQNLIQHSFNQTSVENLKNIADVIVAIFTKIKEKIIENILFCFSKSEYILQAIQILQKIIQNKLFFNKMLSTNFEVYQQFVNKLKSSQNEFRQIYKNFNQMSKISSNGWQYDDTYSID